MSKKPSAANDPSSTPRRDSVTFFTDRCLGAFDVPNALRAAGLRVEVHKDHFNSDCPDEDWLAEVGRRGWIVLTKDKSLRSRQVLVAALMRSNTGTFVLTSGNTTGPQNASVLVASIPQMLAFIDKFQTPFLAQITASATASLILSHQGMIDLHGELRRE